MTRLIGQETEYAIIATPRLSGSALSPPTARQIYQSVCSYLSHSQPTAASIEDTDQLFLASGGAITLESNFELENHPGGLIEIATPEVRSASDLLDCQRAIDRLVAAAVEQFPGYQLRAIKNSADTFGHVYGCQENYEAIVAHGPWLWIYRICMVVVMMSQAVASVVCVPIIAVLTLAISAQTALQRRRSLAGAPVDAAAGRPPCADEPLSRQSVSEQARALPCWAIPTATFLLRLCHRPIVWQVRFIGRHVAFRSQRRHLLPLLASRVVVCGSGSVDADGNFLVSAKAAAIDRIADCGGFDGEHPVFAYGHWLSEICSKSVFTIHTARRLLHRRQRLQIGVGDSNMSDLAEYTKFAMVGLVLDAVESGKFNSDLILRDPLAAIHTLSAGTTLSASVMTSSGKLTAIEIQRHYLAAATEFVMAHPGNLRGDAELALRRWSDALEIVESYGESGGAAPAAQSRDTHARDQPATGALPDAAVARIDWLQKRWMLDQLPQPAGWAEEKKIDIRMHELSPDGYHQQAINEFTQRTLTTESTVELRGRNPPGTSPAANRAWVIREFTDNDAESDTALRMNWTHAILYQQEGARRFDFH